LLFIGLLASATGSWAYVAALLVYVYDQTHSLGWVAAAGIARYLPSLIFSAYGGVIADRYERVRVMVVADVVCMAIQAGLAVTAALEGPAILAVLFAVLTSIANVVYNPAVAAMLPQLAGEDDLAAANALNGTIENVVVLAGPAIGAGLVAVSSPAVAFAVNAASFGLSAILVNRMHARSRPVDVTEGGEAGPLRQMIVGLKTMAESPSALVLVGFCGLVTFVYGTDTVLFVGASAENLGTGPNGFGYLMAGLGVGGILMATAVSRLESWDRLATIIYAGAALYSLPTALLAVIHSPVLAFFLEVIRGGATLVVDVLAITALQRAVPEERMARVFGAFFAVVYGCLTIGALVAPPVVSALGLDGALVFFAVAPAAIALLGVPQLVRVDRAAVQRMALLSPRIAFLESLGIFASASRTALERLAAGAEPIRAHPGARIVREGEPADALYALFDGSVDVAARGEAGEEPEYIRTMGPGTYFGEIGLLEQIPRTATVTAAEESRLYRIDGDLFLDVLMGSPPATSLVNQARMRLARTHPSRRPSYEPDAAPAGIEA
jgi:CRP-like cAMP-binding protein/predicted MFS family arabinose efflux permease